MKTTFFCARDTIDFRSVKSVDLNTPCRRRRRRSLFVAKTAFFIRVPGRTRSSRKGLAVDGPVVGVFYTGVFGCAALGRDRINFGQGSSDASSANRVKKKNGLERHKDRSWKEEGA